MKISFKHLWKHETKKEALLRFLAVVSIVIGYFIFVSIKFGVESGLWITFLTWSFFVFCTPIADAGFLLDFPIRIITGIRMFYSEIIVWVIAAILNLYALLFLPEIYDQTLTLTIFKFILTHPFPYGSIILLSSLGTFLSVYFGDELLDVIFHRERVIYHKHNILYKFFVLLSIFALTVAIYSFMISSLGLHLL